MPFTIFKMHDVNSVCFVNTVLTSLTITCIVYTCYKCLACESKMASILNLIVGSSVGCPLNCPLFTYLKEVGYPLSCPLSCPLYPYMAVVGRLICMAKFPWAAHEQPTPLPTELPTFSCLEVVGCPLNCPLFPYMEVVGSLICMAKFPWAAHGQPTPLPTELPTELPTVSIYGSSGQPNLHGKIPMGSPRAAHSVAHVQPMGSEVGSSPVFFRMGCSHCTNKSNTVDVRGHIETRCDTRCLGGVGVSASTMNGQCGFSLLRKCHIHNTHE